MQSVIQRSSLIDALENKLTVTENGMLTQETSGRDLLDAFFKLGASRNLSDTDIRNMAIKAYGENPLLALKLFAYNRDVRGGQGERRSFRIAFKWLATSHPDVARAFIKFVPVYGRFDDVFEGIDTPIETDVLDFYAEALEAGDALAGKWAPREKKSKSHIATKLRKHMEISPRDYRKMVTAISTTVETHMCAKEWSAINYSHVPSIASNRYRKAFNKNDTTRYQEYLAELAKPKSERDPSVKVNASAIFPHEIVSPILNGRVTNATLALLNAQWDALPEFLPEDSRTLALVDTSGSMGWDGGLPRDVAVSLGLYLSQRLTGIFKDVFMTFSMRPKLQRVSGTLSERVSQMARAGWDGNTNLELAFLEILNSAVSNNVPPSDMPTTIIIFSDMQFDQCINGTTAIQMVRQRYAQAGYDVPNVIFWNLRTSNGVPVRYNDSGVALVSGFSPSTLQHILSGRLDPVKQMLDVLESDRYSLLNSIKLT
jgi:hypothetical protein